MSPIHPSQLPEPFATVLALYERGQIVAAYEAGKEIGPLESWPPVEALTIAGRIAMHLGAPRRGSLLHLQAFRAHPKSPLAQYSYLVRVRERRGALAAWLESQRLGAPRTEDAGAAADYHGLCAMLLGALRDFGRAEDHLSRAREDGARAYWYVERSDLYLQEDRYADALATIEEGIALHPDYPPCIISYAGALVLLDRNDDALTLLREKIKTTQASGVAAWLTRVLLRVGQLEEAESALARYDEFTPLKEKSTAAYIANVRAEIATRRGDYPRALEHFTRVGQPFHDAAGARLRTFLEQTPARPTRHVELPVTFVRQHHLTCAPATLTAISHFWRRPAEHLAVAEEICYDGTSLHSERRWAEKNGWVTREFRVDWQSATALIDRGVPFTLCLADLTAGHLQAVIGYDEPTGILYTRDPTDPSTLETDADALFKAMRALGPRGLAMVPAAQAELLDGLSLPDSDVYDRYHALQLALEEHDRERAQALYGEMLARDASHRLTLTARCTLAVYDANPREQLMGIDALLEIFPDDGRLLFTRLQLMKQLSSRDDRLAWLDAACARAATDPIFRIERATELADDHRQLHAAEDDVLRALRLRHDYAYAVFVLAGLNRQLGRAAEALELFRVAACLDDGNEGFAHGYFDACRSSRRSEDALALLRERARRLGGRSGAPAITLFRVLEVLDRTREGLEMLEEAVARRPEDGELRLFAADACRRNGRPGEARAHRAAAEGLVKRAQWLAVMARESQLEGEQERALSLWGEVLTLSPLDMPAHRATSVLIAAKGGREQARERLRAACAAFPHHFPIRELYYEWTEDLPAAERELAVRELIRIDAANAWAVRELALNLRLQNRDAEAIAIADDAIALEPGTFAGHSVKGQLLEEIGDLAGAADCYRAALRRQGDAAFAMRGLLRTAGTSRGEQANVLAFMESELHGQAVLDDGMVTFRQIARGVLTPNELLVVLRRAHEQRPDQWHTWSALGRHLSEMGRTDEALDVARRATESFSMVPRLWLDLSFVHRDRRDRDGQLRALERCRELNPQWTAPILELVEVWEEGGQSESGVALLRAAIKRTPLESDLLRRLSALHDARRERDLAVTTARELLRISPDDAWAWNSLAHWSDGAAGGMNVIDLAREFADARPAESAPLIRLVELLLTADRPADALEAAERAIASDPRNSDAHDIKVRALVTLRRFAEADAACRPAVFGEQVPFLLRGREAWVDAQRGDTSLAIKKMERIVAEYPDYRWGWTNLMEWNDAQKQYSRALRAAERLHWLDPSAISTYGWMGELKENLRDPQGAREIYERAMWLQPSYLFAGSRYFHLQRSAGDFKGAERTIEIMRPFASAAFIQAMEAELALSRDDAVSAIARLADLCRDPSNPLPAIDPVVKAIIDKKWNRQLQTAMKDVMRENGFYPAAPAIWGRSRIAEPAFATARELDWLAGLGDAGEAAVLELLNGIGRPANAAQGTTKLKLKWHLWAIRRRFDASRKRSIQYWAKIGYVLVSLKQFDEAAEWLADWREREALESWMLHNLAVALSSTKHIDDAREVLRHIGNQMASSGQLSSYIKLLCVLGASLDGDLPLAERLLLETPADAVEQKDKPLRDYAAVLVDLLSAPGEAASVTRERTTNIRLVRDDVQGVAVWALLREVEKRVAAHTGTKLPPKAAGARRGGVARKGREEWPRVRWWWLWVPWLTYQILSFGGREQAPPKREWLDTLPKVRQQQHPRR